LETLYLSLQKLLTEHPVRQGLMIPLEGVEVVDHSGKLALTFQLLLQPGAGQPVGRVVVVGALAIAGVYQLIDGFAHFLLHVESVS